MKQKIIPILIVLTGFLLLFFPFTSNYLFEKSAGSTVESYQEKAALHLHQMRSSSDLTSVRIRLQNLLQIKKT